MLVAQSCSALCNPMDSSPPDTLLFCTWNFLGKNTGKSCHSLLQGIFLTQGSNLSLWHCRQILYHWSHCCCCCCCHQVASVVSDFVWPQKQQPTRLPRPWDQRELNSLGPHRILQENQFHGKGPFGGRCCLWDWKQRKSLFREGQGEIDSKEPWIRVWILGSWIVCQCYWTSIYRISPLC